MTLITQIWKNKLGLLVGEGRTNTNGKIINDNLRKIYKKDNICIAFAGNTWINKELEQKDIFVPNELEHFLEIEYDENIIELSKKLNYHFKSLNPKLNTEFFIYLATENDIFPYHLSLVNETLNNSKEQYPEFGLKLSRFDDKSNEQFTNILTNKWEEKFNDIPAFRNLDFINSLSKNDLIDFVIDYYAELYINFNDMVGESIGNSIDIIVVEPNNIYFHQKVNKTIEEMKK